MPVLGHAFVGLTTAVYTRPAVRRRLGTILWTPILVGLAYLPDITLQLGDLTNLGRWRTATHSILFAVLGAIVLGGPIARLAGISLVAGWALALFSMLVHVLLDLLQGTHCSPFWPLSSWSVALPDWFPLDVLGHEALWFGGGCAVLILARAIVRWGRSTASVSRAGGRGAVLLSYGLTGIILVLAAGTHYLCYVREQQLVTARTLIRRGRPVEALPLLDRAGRWPHEGNRGGVEYARGEAYEVMGNRYRAEQCYLAALRERPRDFWILSDLALLYASFPEPFDERRRRVDPLVALLREHYSDRRELPRIVAKIERRLNPAATQPARSSLRRPAAPSP